MDRCAALMEEHHLRFLPVTDQDGRLVGSISDRELALRVLAAGKPPSTPVGLVMNGAVAVAHPDDELSAAEEGIARARTPWVVITDEDGQVLGTISLSDLAAVEDRFKFCQLYQAVSGQPSAFLPLVARTPTAEAAAWWI